MTNLPIAHHPHPSPAKGSTPGGSPFLRSAPSATSGNTANTLQRNSSADDQTARGAQLGGVASAGAEAAQAKMGSGLPAAGDPLAGVAEPFSELLARQIGETGSHTPVTARDTPAIDINTAIEDTVPTSKEAQDQTEIGANASGDTASILAAMLLQFPVSNVRGQGTEEGSTPPLTAEGVLRSGGEPNGVPLAATRDSGELRQMIEGGFQQAAGRSTLADGPIPMSDSRPQTDPPGLIPLSIEAVEHAEMTANSASPSQTGTAQTNTQSALSTVMPYTPGHNTAGTTQTITAPLGSNGWAEDFTQKINWMCTQKNQVAELHLTPPDLGPLDVILKISGNQATVLFTSPHGAVRDAVENALPKLREVLADNGIMLGNAMVSDQSPQDRSADGHMNQGFGTAAQRAVLDEASNSTGLSPAVSQNGPARRHNGMVDTFA